MENLSLQMEMDASAAKVKELYNQQGFLTALPVLKETELSASRRAFAELEEQFGKKQLKREWRKRKEEKINSQSTLFPAFAPRWRLHAVQPPQCPPPVSLGQGADHTPPDLTGDQSHPGPWRHPAGLSLHLQVPSAQSWGQRWRGGAAIRGLASGHEVTSLPGAVAGASVDLQVTFSVALAGTGVSLVVLFCLCGWPSMTRQKRTEPCRSSQVVHTVICASMQIRIETSDWTV